MKHLIFLSFLFVACGTTNNSLNTNTSFSNSIEQIFISGPGNGSSGKCYVKTKPGNNSPYLEVLCAAQITRGIVQQIQTDLVRLNYEIESSEISKSKIGSTTKLAIKEFQNKNNMASVGLDWATINRLKTAL